jgi:hypothetical protein
MALNPGSKPTSVLPESLSSTTRLIDRLMPAAVEAFPFERELALYLLLVGAVWPNDRHDLLTAARIFSGSVNFHASNLGPNIVFTYQDQKLRFHREFSTRKIALFNESFFDKIGGQNSLLFTRSAIDFHRDLKQQLTELLMMHDVIDFLLKASVASPRLSSSNLAFHAIAKNLFRRKNGYGVPAGAKRKRSVDQVTTANSVREKWKRAPETILLSYVLTTTFAIQNYSPCDPNFLGCLSILARQAPGLAVTSRLAIIQSSLRRNSPKQNRSIEKWSRFPMPKHFTGLIGGALRFSEDQLNRLLELSDGVLPKPLSTEQKADLRTKNKTFSPIRGARHLEADRAKAKD